MRAGKPFGAVNGEDAVQFAAGAAIAIGNEDFFIGTGVLSQQAGNGRRDLPRAIVEAGGECAQVDGSQPRLPENGLDLADQRAAGDDQRAAGAVDPTSPIRSPLRH